MLKPNKRLNMEPKDLLNPTDETNERTVAVYLVEMVHDEEDQRFTESSQKEFGGILTLGSVKVVDIYILPPDVNFIGNRCVQGIKYPNKEFQRFKVRWNLLADHKKYGHKIVTKSPILMPVMPHVILAIPTTLLSSTLGTCDVEQAYSQSKPFT